MRANGWGSPDVFVGAGSSAFAFAPSGISARVSGLKTSACVICNAKYRSESDTLNNKLKNLRGVGAAGWGEPCPALRDASETSTNRGNALGRGASSPQLEAGFFLERLIYRYLSRSKKPAT